MPVLKGKKQAGFIAGLKEEKCRHPPTPPL
jgi:hypothetical protein